MRARRQCRKRLMAEINVVPYIDVMLVMLVIFMITAPLLTQGVQVELPAADAEPMSTDSTEPLVVTVDAKGRLYMNLGENPDQPVSEELVVQRTAAVLRHKPKTPVMVRGDRSVEYGAVVRAMVLLQRAGAPSVGLVTEPPEGAGR